jgi:hypothetical protein
MKTIQAHGKISDHFLGVGTVTRDMVVQRAREMAMINGRPPNHYTADDFQEAKRELTGATPTTFDDSEDDPVAGLTSWDEEPGSAGHPVEKNEIPDEQTYDEQLVEEGVNEADHEQMVEGSRCNEFE